jgi:hypothetical protein
VVGAARATPIGVGWSLAPGRLVRAASSTVLPQVDRLRCKTRGAALVPLDAVPVSHAATRWWKHVLAQCCEKLSVPSFHVAVTRGGGVAPFAAAMPNPMMPR